MSKDQTSHTVATSPTLNRRSAARFMAAAPFAAGALLNSPSVHAKQTSATGRDPLVQAMAPTVVGENGRFRANRGLEITLNTVDYTEAEAQNNLDLAVLEMFSVMHNNNASHFSGQLPDLLLQNYIPEGLESSAYSQLLSEGSDDELAILIKHYPPAAVNHWESEYSYIDPRLGLEIEFIDVFGLFDFNWLAVSGQQIRGFTPRLTMSNGLRIEMYRQDVKPPTDRGVPVDYLDAQAHSHLASGCIQAMALSYGDRDAFHGPENNSPYSSMLFDPPYVVFPRISSLLSGRPEGPGNYFGGLGANYLLWANEIEQ